MKKLVIYPGRFQPFHKGHAQVFQWLKNKFGDAYIATSDKVEAPKSPFNFQEKKQMMRLAGVPAGKIKQVLNPYMAREILKDFDPKTTVLIFAVSQKDMEEDPRFNFAPTKSGKPGYLQPYAGNEKKLKPFGDATKMQGYVIVTPTFTFDVLGKPATSASELRKQFMKLDNKKQKEFITDLFGKYDADIHKLMKKKIGAMQKSVSQLKENFAIGLTFARKEMPQIGASDSFVKYLKSNDVQSKRVKLDPNELKSSQMEFDQNKIDGLRGTPSSNPIIVSRDNHVIDGHHRWLADKLEGRSSDAYMCDLPVLELLHQAKIYSKQLKEEVTRKELAPMLDSFVSFASDKLGLKSMPKVRYKTDGDNYNSFAAYNPSSNELSVHTMNRHPMDIFRSVAHELVHHKQNEDGRLGKDIEKEGATGSDIENEANSEAGKIMRWFAKANPNMFSKTYVVEEIANSTSSGAIRGLGNVTGNPLIDDDEESNYLTQNQQDTESLQRRLQNMLRGNSTETLYSHEMEGSWMDQKGRQEYHAKTTKGIRVQARTLNEGINDPGKLKAIFLAGGPGSGKDYVMNATLAGEGLKEINSDVAFEYLMQKNGLDLEMPDEERVERDIVRGRAKNITKEQERLALSGRMGLIINGTADDLEKIKKIKSDLERDGYETMMVFVNTSNDVSRERNVERGKMGKRKVPDGTDKQGVPDKSPNIRQEKWDLAQKNIGELQKIFGNERFTVLDNTADIRKVSPDEKEKVLVNFNRVRRMAQQFVRAENKNPAAAKWISGEAQKRGITQYQEPKRYKSLTQVRTEVPNVVHKPDNSIMLQARRLGLSYYGFGRFGRKVNGINKVMFHSKGGKLVRVQTMNEEINENFEKYMIDPANREVGSNSVAKIYKTMTPGQEVKEDNVIPRGKFGLPQNGGLGPEYGNQVSPALVTGFANIGNAVYEASKSIKEWAINPKTQQKFSEKYGNLAEQKLIEAALRLEAAGCGCDHSKPKSVKKIKETVGYPSAKDPQDEMGTVGVQVKEEQLNERGADSKGYYRSTESGAGLTAKGAKKFGVQTAVTEPNPTGKRAARRKSFCARMSGMPGPMKDEKGRPTRKAASLRRWRCRRKS